MQLASSLGPRFYVNIFKCKHISETGAQQVWTIFIVYFCSFLDKVCWHQERTCLCNLMFEVKCGLYLLACGIFINDSPRILNSKEVHLMLRVHSTQSHVHFEVCIITHESHVHFEVCIISTIWA